MSEEKVRRPRRTPEQKLADLEAKIQNLTQNLEGLEDKRAAANEEFDKKAAGLKAKIAALERKKTDIQNPKPRAARKPRKTKKQKIQEIIKLANKSGLKPEEIAARLGVEKTEE